MRCNIGPGACFAACLQQIALVTMFKSIQKGDLATKLIGEQAKQLLRVFHEVTFS
jgi:hypothetical protein